MNAAGSERIVAYLLGELDPESAGAFERELRGDAELRTELERMRAVTTRLQTLPEEGWDAEPPPLALPVEELPRAPAPAAAPSPPRRAWWSPGRAALAGAFAAVLVAAGIGIGIGLGGEDGESANARSVDLAPLEADGSVASGVLTLEGGGSEAELTVDGLPESGSGYYELWLLDDDGETVSLGSFKVGADGKATASVSLPVDPENYRSFDVSIESDDGDPAHSGNSVLRAPTRS